VPATSLALKQRQTLARSFLAATQLSAAGKPEEAPWLPGGGLSPLTPSAPPLTLGCRHVYLDMGLNIGSKLRVLYEPERERRWQKTFDEVFGPRKARGDVCAIGFEPNPNHTRHLMRAVAQYTGRGHRVHVFQAAVGVNDSKQLFFTDTARQSQRSSNEWGASMLMYKAVMAQPGYSQFVISIGLEQFLRRQFINVSTAAPRARVIAKMDVEGYEYTLLPAAWRAICQSIDVLQLERHDRFFSAQWQKKTSAWMHDEGRVAALDATLYEMKQDPNCITRVEDLGKME